jgi:hypothetical protein
MKLEELAKLTDAARDAGSVDSLVANVQPVIDRAVAGEQLDKAADLMDDLYALCLKPAGRRWVKAVAEDRNELNKTRRFWQQVQAARAKLETEPGDANAHLAIGRWECFQLGQWQSGLQHLTQGSGEQLKQLAAQDLAAENAGATQQVAVADAWYGAAEQASDSDKRAMLRRAGHWYQRARSGVTSQLVMIKIDKRLQEIAFIPPLDPSLGPKGEMPLGKWFYVLGLVDPAVHSVDGNWARFREAVGTTQPSASARFMIPAAVDGAYELEFDFTSPEGDSIVASLPVKDHGCSLHLAAQGGKISGIQMIDGQYVGGNPTKTSPAGIIKNRRHSVFVRVELAEDAARLSIALDGRPYIVWQGRQSSLSQPSALVMPNPRAIGLGAEGRQIIFHTARVRLLSDSGTILPSSAAFRP